MASSKDLAISFKVEKENRYDKTRKRITRFKHDMSDKEIIEYLAEEIEQYRNEIKHLTETIENKEREIDTTNLETDELTDKNLKEITTTNIFADGKLIETITKYKYNK